MKRLLPAFGFGEEVGHAECSFQYMFGVPKLHVHMHGFQDIGEKEEEEEKPPSRPVATPARARATAKAKSSPASSKKGSPASMEASPSVASTPASCKKGSPASTVASPALVRPSSNDSPVPNAPAESPGSVKPSSAPNLTYRDRKSTSFLSDLTAADDSEVAPGESRESLDSLNSLGDLCDAARNMSLAKEAVEVTEIPDSDDDDGICSRFQEDKVFVNEYLATLRAEVKRRKFPTLICLCPHDGCMAACLM